MIFVLVLCGLVIGVYLLLIALLLVAGFYGVFGAIVYGPFFIIRYIWRVFDGEDALEKSYDVRKPKKARVREPREVSNVRLTDRKPSKIKRIGEELGQSDKAGRVSKPREVSNVKLINNKPKNKVISGGAAVRKVADNKEPKRETKGIQTKQATRKDKPKKMTKGIQTKQATRKDKPKKMTRGIQTKQAAIKVEIKKANPRKTASKKPNPRKVEPQGITPNIPTTSPLTDYPDMV